MCEKIAVIMCICFIIVFVVNQSYISQVCQNDYDKEFASGFEEFLNRDLSVSLASANNEDTPEDVFLDYIEAHLKAESCPSPCTRLWSVMTHVLYKIVL